MSEASRSASYYELGVGNCDKENHRFISPSWKGPGWYKFVDPAGTKIATSPPKWKHCGTSATGWMDDSHPTEVGQTKTVRFCFNFFDSVTCKWNSTGEVTKCGEGEFVYKLPTVPICHSRYCAAP